MHTRTLSVTRRTKAAVVVLPEDARNEIATN
jgi:hypothetical protein